MDPVEKTIWSNPFFKFVWFVFTIFLGILAVIGLIILWFLLGATYEIIECYEESKIKKKREMELSRISNSVNFYQSPQQSHVNHPNPEIIEDENDPKVRRKKFWIYFGLVCLGILLQPLFLLLKFLECTLEFFRKMGCWLIAAGSV